jgi:hypothetical protein
MAVWRSIIANLSTTEAIFGVGEGDVELLF